MAVTTVTRLASNLEARLESQTSLKWLFDFEGGEPPKEFFLELRFRFFVALIFFEALVAMGNVAASKKSS